MSNQWLKPTQLTAEFRNKCSFKRKSTPTVGDSKQNNDVPELALRINEKEADRIQKAPVDNCIQGLEQIQKNQWKTEKKSEHVIIDEVEVKEEEDNETIKNLIGNTETGKEISPGMLSSCSTEQATEFNLPVVAGIKKGKRDRTKKHPKLSDSKKHIAELEELYRIKKEELQNVKSTCSFKSESNKTLSLTILELKNENEELNDKNVIKEQVLVVVKERNSEMDAVINELKAQNNALSVRIAELEKDKDYLENLKDRVKDLEETNKNMSEEKVEMCVEINGFKERHNKLRNLISDLEKFVEDAVAKLKDMQMKIAIREKETRELKMNAEQMSKKLPDLKNRSKCYVLKRNDAVTQNIEINKRNEMLENRLKEIKNVEAENGFQAKKITELKTKVENFKKCLDILKDPKIFASLGNREILSWGE